MISMNPKTSKLITIKFILFFGLLLEAFGCNSKARYIQKSPEIEIVKSNIGYYVEREWEPYEASYVEDATIFFSTSEENPVSMQEIIEEQISSLEPLCSYSFDREKDLYEMVRDDKVETWVNYWGLWKGTNAASGELFEMPVQLTSKFVDGKNVKPHGYYDNTVLTMALIKIREAAEAQVAMVM